VTELIAAGMFLDDEFVDRVLASTDVDGAVIERVSDDWPRA
jgi:hypothetical protein